ncbi:MAG: hypothetical protein OWU32_06400 [Firmicutes bacterium]|nr:hypothetical protein [Bacillota bacterium]
MRDSGFTFRQDDAGKWREVHELPRAVRQGARSLRSFQPKGKARAKSARELRRIVGFGSLALSGFLFLQLGGHDPGRLGHSWVDPRIPAFPNDLRTQTVDVTGTHAGPWITLPAEGAAPSGGATLAHALTLPPLSMLMYEAGVFANAHNAAAAAADYKQSGVLTQLSEEGSRTALLLGPTISPHGDGSFEQLLERAQVPYFLRPFSIPSRVLSDAGWSPAQYLYLSRLVTGDLQYLQAAIAQQSGFQVLATQRLQGPAGSAWPTWPASVGGRPGTVGARLEEFNGAVDALQRESRKGGGSASVSTEMSDLCRAVVAYQDIVRQM